MAGPTVRPHRRGAVTASVAGVLALLGVLLVACGGGNGGGNGSDGRSVPVAISAPWARTSPAGATSGAAYLTLTASQDDALTGAVVDPSVAAAVQLHSTTMAGHEGAHGAGASASATTTGAMTMKPVDRIELPAGKAVTLAPGGYHLMLVELVQPLRSGATFALTLRFALAGEVTIEVPVRDNAP